MRRRTCGLCRLCDHQDLEHRHLLGLCQAAILAVNEVLGEGGQERLEEVIARVEDHADVQRLAARVPRVAVAGSRFDHNRVALPELVLAAVKLDSSLT